MNIRPAESRDIPTLSNLYAELVKDMHDLQPDNYQSQIKPDFMMFQKYIDADNATIFVADTGEKVVGFALIFTAKTPDIDIFVAHQFGYVADLIVTQKYQKRGIGTKLLKECQTWTVTNQLDYTELNVLPTNEAGRQLYEKLDYKAQNTTLRLG